MGLFFKTLGAFVGGLVVYVSLILVFRYIFKRILLLIQESSPEDSDELPARVKCLMLIEGFVTLALATILSLLVVRRLTTYVIYFALFVLVENISSALFSKYPLIKRVSYRYRDIGEVVGIVTGYLVYSSLLV